MVPAAKAGNVKHQTEKKSFFILTNLVQQASPRPFPLIFFYSCMDLLLL
jgi:hypothetical protein